jgi:hypothetical protein
MEMIKRLDEIQATLEQRFNQVILETETAAKEIIRQIAYDTGDMEFAVSHKLAVRDGENWVGEIFVDPGKLYNRRKPYQYKRGSRKGSYAPTQRNYPVYVHGGTPKMKARPYFRLAWEKIRTSKEFQNLTKDIILKETK